MGKLVKLAERTERLFRKLGNVYDVREGFIVMGGYINSCYALVNAGITEREAKAMNDFDFYGITRLSYDLHKAESMFNREFPNSFFGEIGGLAYGIFRIKRFLKICEHFDSINYKSSTSSPIR